MLASISSSILTGDFGSTLILLLGMPSVTSVIIVVLNLLKKSLLSRSLSKPQKVEIRSGSGNTIVVEMGGNMSKEETEKLIERLQNFGRQSSNI